ncbi:unnamed protein product [Cochlearia groenlandica]
MRKSCPYIGAKRRFKAAHKADICRDENDVHSPCDTCMGVFRRAPECAGRKHIHALCVCWLVMSTRRSKFGRVLAQGRNVSSVCRRVSSVCQHVSSARKIVFGVRGRVSSACLACAEESKHAAHWTSSR